MVKKLFIKPVINNDVIWKENDGEVVLLVKNKGIINRALQLLLNKPKISYIHLDEIGSYVWKLLDGNNSIYDIGKAIEKDFNSSDYHAYNKLAIFLDILKENKFIKFI